MLNIYIDKGSEARCPFLPNIVHATSNIEGYFDKLTGTTTKFGWITVVVDSNTRKPLPYKCKPFTLKELMSELGKLFKDVEAHYRKTGKMPPDYERAKVIYERLKRMFEQSEGSDYDSLSLDSDYIWMLIEIIDNIEYSWKEWAQENDLPGVAGRCGEICGRLKNAKAYVSVEYSNQTITLYELVLGDYTYYQKNWEKAYAEGLFYAYHDLLRSHAKAYIYSDLLIQSLCAYCSYHYVIDYLGGYDTYNTEREWRNYSMEWWPYSGAFYIETIRFKHMPEEYLFRRIFGKSLTNSTKALEDLVASFTLYEGRAPKIQLPNGKNGPVAKFRFNGIDYRTGVLVPAVVAQYIKDHPAEGSAKVMDAFNKNVRDGRDMDIVLRESDALARKAASADTRDRFFFTMPLSTADVPVVVSHEWGRNNINYLIDRAKSFGYVITKVQ